jgi:hypothetical protein
MTAKEDGLSQVGITWSESSLESLIPSRAYVQPLVYLRSDGSRMLARTVGSVTGETQLERNV